jgi:hypothetical protein
MLYIEDKRSLELNLMDSENSIKQFAPIRLELGGGGTRRIHSDWRGSHAFSVTASCKMAPNSSNGDFL